MLTVGVDDEDELAGRVADGRLHGGAVAFVVRMTDDTRAGRGRARRGVVNRPVVDDDDFVPRGGLAQRGHERADRRSFVEGGHDDRHAGRQGVRHWAAAWINRSMAASHEMPRTRSYPASPIALDRFESPATRAIAAPRLSGSAAETMPVSPSVTNSSGPPASVVVTTGLRARNASSVT